MDERFTPRTPEGPARGTLRATASGLILALALVAAGCGGSGSAGPSSSSASAKAAAAAAAAAAAFPTIELSSPAVGASGSIAARYTCDGKNVAPPLTWGKVPRGVKELAVFLVKLTPGASTARTAFTAEWAIAGLKPTVHALASGQVPSGAYLGSNGNGGPPYSICPAKGETGQYAFAVYALRPSVKPAPGFSENQLLREIASGPSPTSATAGGLLRVTYTRK